MNRSEIVARIEAHPLGETPGAMRTAFSELVRGADIPLPDGVCVDMRADGSARVTGPGDGPEIVWFHGGGYVFGGPATHLRPAAHLAVRGACVTLPAYPLAPEAVWPAQRDAALAAIPSEGPLPVLAGDSAGGHLALVTALALARAGRRPPALLLFSPNTDRSGLSETRKVNDPRDPMVDDAGDAELARLCFGARAADDPDVSPALDDLSLLPPTAIEVGTSEVLLGDARALARRGWSAGSYVTLHESAELLHMGQLWVPAWRPAADSLDRALAFARRYAPGSARSSESA